MHLGLSIARTGLAVRGGGAVIAARFDPSTDTVEVRVTPRVSARFDPVTDTIEVRVNG